MGRTFIRQDAQIAQSLTFNDAVAPGAAMESGAANIEDDLNNIRSIASLLKDNQAGNWYDDLVTPSTFTGEGETQRGVDNLNADLHDLERKRVLADIFVHSDIVVGVAATGTLTAAGNFANTETVTLGSKTYTFQTVLTDVDGNVLIGATASDSLDNLIAAVNLDAGAGSLYANSMTKNADIYAAAGAGDTMDVTAILAGTGGNSLATTETGANASFGGATLSGGAATGNKIILAPDQLPSNKTAAIGAVTTLGSVAATHTGTFGDHSLDEVPGNHAVSPKNLATVVEYDTHDPILSGGRTIYALFQSESASDGSTLSGATPNRAQLSFVRLNAAGTDLEAVPATDIQGQTVHYSVRERKALLDLNEQDFLRGAAIDIPAAATVTRQVAYDNQGATPVDLTNNAILDLEGPGLAWRVRDDLEAVLLEIIEGSAGGTSQINIGADVDEFDIDAAVVNVLSGMSIRSGGTRPIDVGVNDGVVESTAGDLELQAAAELVFDDGYRGSSTFSIPIPLADSAAEWNSFETNFGEVSLLNAISQAYSGQIRNKVQAVLTADVTADTDVNGPGFAANADVNLLPYNNVTFVSDVEVYLNGELLRNAANDGGGEDVYPGTSPTNGDLKFQFPLKGTGSKPDQLTVIVNGQ